jgi:hypothetical protein
MSTMLWTSDAMATAMRAATQGALPDGVPQLLGKDSKLGRVTSQPLGFRAVHVPACARSSVGADRKLSHF